LGNEFGWEMSRVVTNFWLAFVTSFVTSAKGSALCNFWYLVILIFFKKTKYYPQICFITE